MEQQVVIENEGDESLFKGAGVNVGKLVVDFKIIQRKSRGGNKADRKSGDSELLCHKSDGTIESRHHITLG